MTGASRPAASSIISNYWGKSMNAYVVSYFAVNFMLLLQMIKNLYFTPHTKEYLEERKAEINLFIPLTILFGAVLFLIAYFDEMTNGE
jgi:hypothetical protein